mgnify:CR=1 FL=1
MTPDPGLASWLRLALTPGLGPATLRRLLAQFGLPQAVLARSRGELSAFVSPELLARLHGDEVAAAVEKAEQWAAEPGHHVITLADDGYPKPLLDLSSASVTALVQNYHAALGAAAKTAALVN